MKHLRFNMFFTIIVMAIFGLQEISGRTITLRQMGRIGDSVSIAAVSGDTVLCDSGIYLGFSVNRQFDQLNPVVIKAKVKHRSRIISGSNVNLYGCRGVVLDGFDIGNAANPSTISTNSGLIQVSNNASYVQIKNCHVHDAPYDADCIKVNQVSHVDVIGCDLHDPGLRADNSPQETLDYLDCNGGLIKGNLLRYITQQARQYINAKGGSRDIIIEDNICVGSTAMDHAIVLGGSSGFEYINGGQYEGINEIARNNIIIGSTYGAFQVRNVSGGYIYNNLVYNCTNGTLIGVVPSVGQGSSGGTDNLAVYNNIFYNTSNDMPTVMGVTGTLTSFTHGYNLYYNGGANPRNTYYSITTETGKVLADPNITLNTGTVTYEAILASLGIPSNSPAVNAGTNPGNFSGSPAVPFDIRGVTRPQQTGFDIGALEYTADRVEKNAPMAGTEIVSITPNPFNPSTKITITSAVLEKSRDIALNIYTIQGTLVQELPATASQLSHGVVWDASGKAAGIYVLSLNTGAAVYSKRLVYAK